MSLHVYMYVYCIYIHIYVYIYMYIYIILKLLAVAYPRGSDPLKQTSKCHSFWFTATFDFHELAKVIALQNDSRGKRRWNH